MNRWSYAIARGLSRAIRILSGFFYKKMFSPQGGSNQEIYDNRNYIFYDEIIPY